MSEEVEITEEDNIMLLKLVASLNPSNFHTELDVTELMGVVDMISSMGADICIIWRSSLYISMDDYFYRVSLKDVRDNYFSDSVFEAIHDFSLWYLKQNQ